MEKDLLESLKKVILQSRNLPVIVEGKKDRHSLEKLGFVEIVCINRLPLYKLVENIRAKEVLILTDLDSEGRKIYSELQKQLSARGIRINNHLRKLLFKTEIRQIEGLAKYMEKNS